MYAVTVKLQLVFELKSSAGTTSVGLKRSHDILKRQIIVLAQLKANF